MAVVASDTPELELAAVEEERPRSAYRSFVLAAGMAALSVVAALIAAVGPAHGRGSAYSWPPAALPSERPPDGWYAELALLNRVPASIDVRLPCALSPPLGRADPSVVLATTRRSLPSGGFEIARVGPSLHFLLGADVLASVPWPASCPLRVSVREGELRLPGERMIPTRLETPGGMPIVTSLFTQLDIRRGEPPQVLVRTRDYATSQSSRQIAALLVSAALACVALLLVAGVRRRRSPIPALGHGLRTVWSARHATDAVVVGALALWWLISPTISDDAWLITRFLNYGGAGGLSLYFDQYGANQPLGFWLEWPEHFLALHGLLVLRLPALACLIATWLLCRWLLMRCLPPVMRTNAIVVWTLAASFLIGAVAWGMTLRPEPIVSLLTLIVLAAMVAFTAAPRFGLLTITVPVSALALTGHTTGLLATAPLLAGAPAIVEAIRRAGRSAVLALAALVGAGIALGLVLFTLNADLGTRLEDARLVREGGLHSEPPWHEYLRYWHFQQWGGGTVLRQLSLELLLLCVVALLVRCRSVSTGISTLPTRSIAVGLILLAFIPSKWPWHFGAFVAIGAVAVATEVARLVSEWRLARVGRRRALGSVLLLAAAVAWAWTEVSESTTFDLERVAWSDAFNVYSLLATGIVAAGVVLVRKRRMKPTPGELAADLPGIVLAVTGLCAVVLTAAILVVDSAIAPWSPARLNVDALTHRASGCGLGDHSPGGRRIAAEMSEPSSRALLVPLIATYYPCATPPEVERGRITLPNIVGLLFTQWPFSQKDSPFQAATDLYDFNPVAHDQSMAIYLAKRVVPGFRRIDAVVEPAAS